MRRIFSLTALSAVAMLGVTNASHAAEDKSTFYESISSNILGLFPLTNSDLVTQNVLSNLFENLLERNWDTYEFQPSIASKWEISKDGRQFTFWIDPKAKFWDGSKVTADDVKFSFDVISMPKVDDPALRPYYSEIEKAEVLAPDKIRFTAKDVYFKNFDVVAELTVFEKKFYMDLYKKDNTLAKASSNRTAMGTGPWQVEKWEDNQRVVLKRNPNYWNKETWMKQGRWTYDRDFMKIIQEPSVELEALKRGDLSYLSLSSKQWALQSDTPEFKNRLVKVKTTNKKPVSYGFIGWNQTNHILKDKNVRWALSHLANLPLWVKKFDFNLTEPCISPLGPKSEEHDPNIKAVPFDLSAARKRLADAGWTKAGPDGFLVKDGKKLEVTIIYPTQSKESIEPKLTEYKNEAAKVGVSIVLKSVEWTSFTKLLDDHNFDAVTLAWSREVDPDLKQIWHSDSIKNQGSNFISYSNPALDKLIDENRKTLDRKKRIEILRKAEAMIYEDQPYTFLTERKFSLYAHQKNVVKPKDSFNYQIGTQFWEIKP